MPPLSPSPLFCARCIETCRYFSPRHHPTFGVQCSLRPGRLLFPWTALRKKSSRSEAQVEALIAEQAHQDAERRRPQAVRWGRPDRDEGIGARNIILIDSKTNSLSRPRPLARVLREIDRQNEFVVLIGKSGPEDDALPLCKILLKKDVFEKEKAKQRSQTEAIKSKKRREGKTVELGWATAEGDLLHRFRKAREFLEGGERVTFLVENRQKRTAVPPEKAHALLAKVKTKMEEIPKVVEVGREGQLGKRMKVIFGFKGET